jgi:hypothetical protein
MDMATHGAHSDWSYLLSTRRHRVGDCPVSSAGTSYSYFVRRSTVLNDFQYKQFQMGDIIVSSYPRRVDIDLDAISG